MLLMPEFVTYYCRLKNVTVRSDSQDCFLIEAALVLDMDGIDGSMAIFDDWAAFNSSPRTFILEFFNKDVVPMTILDFREDDSQNSSITMEFEKKKPPISFEEEENKMGLDCTSDVSSELIGFNVQKSCLRGVQNERIEEMARFNILKVNMSQSDKESIIFEVNSTKSEIKNLISSLPEQCSSCILSPGVGSTSMVESPDYFSNSMIVPTIDQEKALPNNNASHQENLKLSELSERKKNTLDIVADQKASHSLAVNESPPPPPPDDHQNGETCLQVEFSSGPESDPEKDGYNWRKYGQKQLKGCEFPCSYHKCTHPNCPVKKKVERSLQGHITEIIYKGSHNHLKPPVYRSSIPSSKQFRCPQIDRSDHPGPGANLEGNPSCASTQDVFSGTGWSDGSGSTSSASFVELGDHSNSLKSSRSELLEAIDASCPISNNKEEKGTIRRSFSDECDTEEEEMESKKRKQELCPIGKRATSRAMRDPRIVVQITCEFDIPDDGYRWRKYGQKVVKGNPNPRSYYKCTYRGCSVRKHVERASDDLKSVISTYEGKHNHDVPSARNINCTTYCPSKPTDTAALQLNSPYSRPDLAQDIFMRIESRAPITTFGLLGTGQQHGPTTSFSFGIDQSNLVSLSPLGSSSMGPFMVPYFPPIHQNMDLHRQVKSGSVMPKREPMNELMLEPDVAPIANTGAG